MSRLENASLDEYERVAEDARKVLAKMKTSLKLSSDPFLSERADQQADSASSGKVSLTFTWITGDREN
jgi:hypothetical protein